MVKRNETHFLSYYFKCIILQITQPARVTLPITLPLPLPLPLPIPCCEYELKGGL